MKLLVTFTDNSFEYIENVIGYVISGQDQTLIVDLEKGMPIVFNYAFVSSVRYVEPSSEVKEESTTAEAEAEAEAEDSTTEEEPNTVCMSEKQFDAFMRRLFNGII